MVVLYDIKIFFQEYWGYILLGISGFGLLGIGVYYTAFNGQLTVIDQKKSQKEETEIKKNVGNNQIFLIDKEVIFYYNWIIAVLGLVLYMASFRSSYLLVDSERYYYYHEGFPCNVYRLFTLDEDFGLLKHIVKAFVAFFVGPLLSLIIAVPIVKIYGRLNLSFGQIFSADFKNFLTIRNGSTAHRVFLLILFSVTALIVYFQATGNEWLVFTKNDKIREKLIEIIMRDFNLLVKKQNNSVNNVFFSLILKFQERFGDMPVDFLDFLGILSFQEKVNPENPNRRFKFNKNIRDENNPNQIDPYFLPADVVGKACDFYHVFLNFLNSCFVVAPNVNLLIQRVINERFKNIDKTEDIRNFNTFVEIASNFFGVYYQGDNFLKKTLETVFTVGVKNSSHDANNNIEFLSKKIKINQECDFLKIKSEDEYNLFKNNFFHAVMKEFRGGLYNSNKTYQNGKKISELLFKEVESILMHLTDGEKTDISSFDLRSENVGNKIIQIFHNTKIVNN